MNIRKILKILLLAVSVIISCVKTTDKVYATSGSTSLYASSSSVTVGNNVNVTLSVSGDSPVMATIYVYYNSSYLQYVSCTSGDYNSGNGKAMFDTYPNTSGSMTITFKTIGVGTTTVSASVSEFIDYDGASVSGYSGSLSTNITINQIPSGGGGNEGGGGGGGGGSYTPSLSRDATLNKITIDGYDLEPGFSSDVTEYKVYVPRGTESLDISATKSSSKATVSSIDGSVKPGWNEIDVKVTAEDDDYTKTYTLNVYVDEEPTVFYSLNEQQLGVVKNLDKVEIYPEHEASDIKVGDNDLTIFNWKAYDIIYLEDANMARDFYIYDKSTDTVLGKYVPIEINERKFVVSDIKYEEFTDLEEFFEPDKVRIGEELTLDGWKYKDPLLKEFKLIYLGDENGEKKLYRYDAGENTLQRYVVPTVEEVIDYKPYIYLSAAVSGLATLLFALIALGRKKTN